MPLLNYNQLQELEIQDRAAYLRNQADQIVLTPNEPDEELYKAKQMIQVLNFYLAESFQDSNSFYDDSLNRDRDFLENQMNYYSEQWISKMLIKLNDNNQPTDNLFGLVKANFLSVISKQTRLITEDLGHFFENIACIAPNCINPETVFGVKLLGVDLIRMIGANYSYVQLKTAENTLTGSQAPRARKELEIYENPFFAAAIKLKQNWTIGGIDTLEKHGIEKGAGELFWLSINIPYDLVLDVVSDMLTTIQGHVVNMSQDNEHNQTQFDF